jgi:methylmalonyl-CoA mutase N-terminal domain/subunit
LEKGAKVVVGVNKYVTDQDQELEILRISEEVEREQRAELARRRAARDHTSVQATLDRLQRAATTDENLIPLLIEAARAEATEGEMVGALKHVWGEYTEPPRF